MTLKIKVLSVFAAFALVLSATATANALTTSELIDLLVSMGIIPADQAAVAQLAVGGSASADSCALKSAPNMTIGAQGASVTELQMYLVDGGYLVMPAGVSYGYFGSLTASALSSYQAAMGISPAAGFFGPVTKASITCSPAVVVGEDDDNDSPSVAGLQGGDGDFKSFDVLGNPDNEDIEEGETVEVLGFEFEADDSDLLVERITVLASSTNANETKPWKVLEEAFVMVDGDEVASVDVSDEDAWDEELDDQYSLDIDDVDFVVEEGDEVEMYIAFTAKDDLDTDELGTWDLSIPSDGVRALNAEGINVYEDDPLEVVSFELTAGEFGTLDLSFDDDDEGNDDDDIDIDDNNETDDVVLYTFEIEAQDNDVEIDEITVSLSTTTGTASNLEDIITELYLEIDGEEFSESVDGAGTASITFDDLETMIDEDDEITVTVWASIDAADDIADFVEGDGIQVTGVSVDFIDSDDDDNTENELASTNGGEITLRESGMMVELLDVEEDESFTADEAGEGDVGTFVIKFEVSAGDEDVYVDGVNYSTSTTVVGATEASSFSGPSSRQDANGNYKVSKGSSETFTFTVEVQAASTTPNTAVKIALEGIEWNTDNSTTTYVVYTSNLDDYETDELFLRGL
jgi:hypothetical protein